MTSSREIIRKLREDGWYLDSVRGDHHYYRHPVKPGKITIPHPVKDLKLKTVRSIERQSGVKLK